MSLQARHALVAHPRTIFRSDAQRQDLLDPAKTQTELVALLTELVHKGHMLLFTAIRSDHHDDSCLGLHSHANGYDADVWPLNSTDPTDYIDASTPAFEHFLADAARSPWLYQVGLAGEADTAADEAAAGRTVFSDGGADHVHLGSGEAA